MDKLMDRFQGVELCFENWKLKIIKLIDKLFSSWSLDYVLKIENRKLLN
jgi:hypothetical protein